MGKWRRRRGILLGTTALLLAAWPVAARTARERTPETPPPLAVRVQYGDSLWTLAKQYGDPHRDVRALVAEMIRVNATQPGQLQPGQDLIIPANCLPTD